MKRGGWLRTRTKLRAKKALVRRTGLRRSRLKAKPPRAAVPRDVRAALVKRSGGLCEIQLPGTCRVGASDPHHRITGKAGGRCSQDARLDHDRLADLLYVCRPCHDEVHRMGAGAFCLGWRVHEREDPSELVVLYRGEPRWLNDLGGVHADPDDSWAGVA